MEKINRLVIIGNGFDLAHGLKTSFNDFINYCSYEILKVFHGQFIKDDYKPKVVNCTISINQFSNYLFNLGVSKYDFLEGDEKKRVNLTVDNFLLKFSKFIESPFINFFDVFNSDANYVYFLYNSFIPFYKDIESIRKLYLTTLKSSISFSDISILSNNLFIFILKNSSNNNWGGIENDYYEILLHISKIKTKNSHVQNGFNELYKIDDLNKEFDQIISHLEKYLTEFATQEMILNDTLLYHLDNPIYIKETINFNSKLSNISDDKDYKISVGNVLFTNFNYTNMIEPYIQKFDNSEECQHIQIHGRLNTPENPIIFGYGDELDDSYKKLEDLNNNYYLKYAKSMHYLTTSNYKKLLDFIDSGYYQIYIWGHSCAVSDRVLLNTLFENKNCVSIKPFYHQQKDGSDNYTDLITNISRSFNNKKLFRSLVVNKKYCLPLTKT